MLRDSVNATKIRTYELYACVCVCVRVCLCVWKCVDFIKYAMAFETIDMKRKKCLVKDMNDW